MKSSESSIKSNQSIDSQELNKEEVEKNGGMQSVPIIL